MEDVIKLARSLEDSDLLIEDASEKLKAYQKNKKVKFLACC